jgi:hypothetical protein
VRLGQLRDPAAVPHLVSRLSDPEWLVRQGTLVALGTVRGEEAREVLERFLCESRPDSPLAAEALAEFGTEATPALLHGLQVGTNPVRLAVLKALGKTRDPASVPGIAVALADPVGGIANAAWDALMRIPGDASLHALAASLDRWPPSTRVAAMRRLAEGGFAPAVLALRRQLDNENEAVVRAAGLALLDLTVDSVRVRNLLKPLFSLRGMRQHHDPRLIPPLLLALEHGNPWLRWEASRWLAYIARIAPCPELALAIPILKRYLAFFAMTPQAEREVHQRTYDLIDGAMDRQLNRPIPAAPPPPDQTTLPRPSATDD